jgi:K+-transporting ATPase ATPase A chain
MARKVTVAEGEGTFHADSPLFAGVLFFSIVIVAALTFIPLLMLSPVVEHLLMRSGAFF